MNNIPTDTTPEGDEFITYTDQGIDYQYPVDYGLSMCMAWDLDLAPTCADAEGMPLLDAPMFCGQNWCYVSDTCD